MSDNGRRLSKRSGAVKKREALDDKLRKRQEEPKIRKQKTLAKNREVKLSDTAEDSDKSLIPNPSVNLEAQSLQADDLEITNIHRWSICS